LTSHAVPNAWLLSTVAMQALIRPATDVAADTA
jgi:hypothetical protein